MTQTQKGLFKDNKALFNVNLERNRIVYVDPETFGGQKDRQLAILNLRHNYLTSFPHLLFSRPHGTGHLATRLTAIDLSDNRMEGGINTTKLFIHPNLAVLRLGGNNLTSIEVTPSKSLRMLDITRNQVKNIGE